MPAALGTLCRLQILVTRNRTRLQTRTGFGTGDCQSSPKRVRRLVGWRQWQGRDFRRWSLPVLHFFLVGGFDTSGQLPTP